MHRTILRAIFAALSLGFATANPATSDRAAAAEFQVNTYTNSSQVRPVIASRGSRGVVAIWTSSLQDGSENGVYLQLLSATAARVGRESRVNTTTLGTQDSAAVAGLKNGGFVAVWRGPHKRGLGVYAQVYTPTGTKQGREFRINSTERSDIVDPVPSVAALKGGGFVVVWQYDDIGEDIFGQRYNANGVKIGGQFKINTRLLDWQTGPHVAGLSDGGFVAIWTSNGQDGSLSGVYGQRFSATGARVGTEFRVNTVTANNQIARGVAAFAAGGFVAVWQSLGQDGSDYGVYAQRFSAAGAKLGGAFKVNTFTTGFQDQPKIAVLKGDRFVVVWQSQAKTGSGITVFGQRYTKAGSRVGGEFQVNEAPIPVQFPALPAVAANGDGFVTLYQSGGRDGSATAIIGRRFLN